MTFQRNIRARRWTLPLLSGAVIGAVGLAAGGVGPAIANQDGRTASGSGSAENAILFVGDGMGSSHRNAGRLSKVGLEGELVMDSLPYVGTVSTDSADPETFVTDSAAGATALASGVKTYNGAIGVDVDGNRVQTLIERAERAGKSTGIVTTAQVTDATGAAFGAHVSDRSEQSEIARQYIEETGVDVLLGGGEDFWYPEGTPGAFPDAPPEDPEEGSRGDKGNLVDRAEQLGYDYVSDARGLRRADTDGKLLGLFANAEMFQQATEAEGGTYDPVVSLRAMTRKAISILSKDKDGFFLVVEEEAVDEMAHSNNAALTIEGVKQLDRAVAVGKRFAERSDTLMVTTADHETGGMAVEDTGTEDESGDGDSAEDGPFPIPGSEFEFNVDWTTTGHTNADVPLTAMGPGAKKLIGHYENTHVHDAMRSALRLR